MLVLISLKYEKNYIKVTLKWVSGLYSLKILLKIPNFHYFKYQNDYAKILY